MSLVFNPAVLPDDPPSPEAVIVNDGWFPDIDPAAIRSEQRVRDNVAPARLREAVLGAMITIGNQLVAWCDAQRAAGHAALDAVPCPTLGGESRLVILYRRAIGAEVRADLIEGYRDTDLTGRGDRQVEDLEPSIGELRRTAAHAIRDILGAGRTMIALI